MNIGINIIFILLALLFLVIILFFKIYGKSITNNILFQPYIANIYEYNEIENFIQEVIKTHDGIDIYGGLYNKFRKPNYDDTIILFSHGNGDWIGNYVNCELMNILSKNGSIFLYDYRGYGLSTGKPSENGLYTDIYSVWNFLIDTKNINPKNIIVYGFSLGCAVSSNLVSNLAINELPKMLVLESPFTNLKNIASDKFKPIAKFAYYDFDNIKHLQKINNKIPVYVFYTKNDEIIPYTHSYELHKKTDCKLIEINGNHNNPIYNKDIIELFS